MGSSWRTGSWALLFTVLSRQGLVLPAVVTCREDRMGLHTHTHAHTHTHMHTHTASLSQQEAHNQIQQKVTFAISGKEIWVIGLELLVLLPLLALRAI
jgi:hypothetical protein